MKHTKILAKEGVRSHFMLQGWPGNRMEEHGGGQPSSKQGNELETLRAVTSVPRCGQWDWSFDGRAVDRAELSQKPEGGDAEDSCHHTKGSNRGSLA